MMLGRLAEHADCMPARLAWLLALTGREAFVIWRRGAIRLVRSSSDK
jgi:hypothetical protein